MRRSKAGELKALRLLEMPGNGSITNSNIGTEQDARRFSLGALLCYFLLLLLSLTPHFAALRSLVLSH